MARRGDPDPAPTFLDVPDGRGGMRRVVRLDRPSAGEYERLVGRVVPTIEAGLGPAVRANRAASGPGGEIRLPRWEPARLGWRRSIRAILSARRPPAVILADIRNCYRTIGPGAVARGLATAGCASADVEAILAFLRRSGLRGLPVGPSPSAVLANAALLPIDRSLRGLRGLRWVDDVLVVAPAADAPSILRVIRTEAAALGLDLNESKTGILTDPAEIASSLLGGTASRAGGGERGMMRPP